MNDLEKLFRKESNLYQILKLFYANVGDRKNLSMPRSRIILYLAERREMSEDEADSAFNYLTDEKLLKSNDAGAEWTSIAHYGVKEIEASIKYPEQPTRHFSTFARSISVKSG